MDSMQYAAHESIVSIDNFGTYLAGGLFLKVCAGNNIQGHQKSITPKE